MYKNTIDSLFSLRNNLKYDLINLLSNQIREKLKASKNKKYISFYYLVLDKSRNDEKISLKVNFYKLANYISLHF